MPHYLLETGATSEAHLDRALSLIGPRFPEVVVEQRYTAREIDRNEMWACRAPNAAHIQRWAAAAQLGPQKTGYRSPPASSGQQSCDATAPTVPLSDTPPPARAARSST